MKLNWKIIGISVGALLGVLVLAAVLFVVFFPKDLAAREAERRIEAATDRDLVLGGDINLTFYPALGFSAEQVSLSNPHGFDAVAARGGVEPAETPFIAADRIVFAVALMPLLRGEIQVKQLILENAEIRLRSKSETEANWTFPTEEEQQTTLEDLSLDDVRLVDSLITFQGPDDAPPLTLEHVDGALSLESLDSPAQLTAALDYRGQRMNIEAAVNSPRNVLEKRETSMTAHVTAAPLEANFDGAFNAENGALRGALEANGASLRQLLGWMGSPMEQGGGFGAYRLTAQMAHLDQTTDLTNAQIHIDDIAAQGRLSLINQENGRLRVNGALSAPSVDLNTYLPPPAQGTEAGGVAVNNSWSADPLDFSGLRALDANLDLALGALRFQRMSFSNVALNLRLANGAADARLSRISLYGGGGTARLIADGSTATPRIAIELNAQNIQAEPLLRDAIGFDKIVGRGRLTASLVGSGASQAAIMRSLRGTAAFNFNDGQYKGVNLAQMARTLQSMATGAAAGQGGATDFAELSSTFAFADGVAATDNMRMLNPYVRLEGRGLINVGAQTIDMRITPRAVNNAQGQGGDATLAGLGIPFRISGSWSRVSFRPALEDVVQNQLRDILSQRGGANANPLGALGDALFGRQPAATTPAETPATPADSTTPAPTTPAQPAPQERPRNPLEDIFRRAVTQGGEEKQQAPPASTP